MRPSYFAFSLYLLVLVGCNSARTPSDVNFAKAINEYLAKRGPACTPMSHQFPIDVPAFEQGQQFGIAQKLVALKQVGLVREIDTTAVVHGMLDPLRGTPPPHLVKRYELTTEGRKYFRQVPGTFGQSSDLCYGDKRVDAIIKWTEPANVGTGSQAEVTYTYRIVGLAPWAEQAEVQKAFADIRTAVSGDSKTPEVAGLQLTSNGWELLEQ